MRKNLLKQLTMALLLTIAVPTLTAQVHVGDILCEGNAIVSPANYPSSGATAIGVVFYVDNTGQHGWAVALHRTTGVYAWANSTSNTSLPDYTNTRQAIYDLDGYGNTQYLRWSGTSTAYPAAYAVDFANGWYLPAIGQLNYLYGNIIEVNASLAIVDGDKVSFACWSSTEAGGEYAWFCLPSGYISYKYFSPDDHSSWLVKTNKTSVRAVRNF
jgi:hypothetical protein